MNYVAIWNCGGRTDGEVLEGKNKLEEHIKRHNSTQQHWKYYELGKGVKTSCEIKVEIIEDEN